MSTELFYTKPQDDNFAVLKFGPQLSANEVLMSTATMQLLGEFFDDQIVYKNTSLPLHQTFSLEQYIKDSTYKDNPSSLSDLMRSTEKGIQVINHC